MLYNTETKGREKGGGGKYLLSYALGAETSCMCGSLSNNEYRRRVLYEYIVHKNLSICQR